MSQSGKIILNQPVPGAGIQTVTGNAGGPVPGDGVANVNLIGAGTITVTGVPGANTLTISSAGLPATYTTDTGAAVPDGAGNLNVVGGANINTDNAVANTITINLNNAIVIPGDIDAHDITATGNLVSQTGDIMATIGDIVAAAGVVHGVGGGLFDDHVTITANGFESTGATILHNLNRGVVQVDGAHTLFSDEGLDGQILIGSSFGPPAWRYLTTAVLSGISFLTGPNSVQINLNGSVGRYIQCDDGFHAAAGQFFYIIGSTNVIVTAFDVPGMTSVKLKDDITLGGFLHATTDIRAGTTLSAGTDLLVNGNAHTVGTSALDGAVTCGGNLTANGNFVVHGTVTATSTMQLTGDAVFNADLTLPNGDLTVTAGMTNTQELSVDNTVEFSAMSNGVLEADAGGVITATNGNPTGTDGQLLTSGAVTPVWRDLQSAGGTVAITVNAGNINLEAGVGVPYAFRAALNVGIPWPANSTVPSYYVFGTISAMTEIYDPQNCFYPGDGINQATYTVPATGLYNFTIKCCVGGSDATLPPDRLPCIASIYNSTTAQDYWLQQTLVAFTNSGGLVPWPHIYFIEHTESIAVTAGDTIIFRVKPQPLNGAGIGRHLQLGPNYTGNGQASVTGYKVA